MKKFILILSLLAGSAHAEFWDGNRLHEKLSSSSYYEQGLAMGYIMGVSDMTLNILHCAPPTATAGQVQDMVAQHLRLYPERRTKTADTIVTDTLKAAWPCPKKESSPGRTL